MATTFTKTFHHGVYSTIDLMEALQDNRTILVTGATEQCGIGFHIAKAFVQARVKRVFITGRRQEPLLKAIEELRKSQSSDVQVDGFICDVSSKEGIEKMWNELRLKNIDIDTLVACAGWAKHILPSSINLSTLEEAFQTNVICAMHLTQAFLKQGKTSGKVLINISTAGIHLHGPANYGPSTASRIAYASMLQHLAEEMPVERLQVISVHPGACITATAIAVGADKAPLEWDDREPKTKQYAYCRSPNYLTVALPGAFCVWVSTPKAAFLHGRFVWANWDVEELSAMQERMEAVPGLLRVGLQGVDPTPMTALPSKMDDREGVL